MIPKEIQENNSKSIKNFLKGFHSESTKESYCKKLVQFLEFHNGITTADQLLQKAKKNPKTMQHMIIDYVEERKSKVSGSTLQQTKGALKHFFEMNDIEEGINWSKISKIIPHARKTGSDRAPTIEEIRTMLELADTRTKCVILMCSSSGIRVGAFDGMTWGDLFPISQKHDGEKTITAAKLTVYKGEQEEYTTFVSPECYRILEQYKKSRESIGEKITLRSPLIRDSWDNNTYRKDKRKEPKTARPLASKTIANMMGEFLKKINLREADSGTHEFKQIHGFRKFFKTNAERACKTIDVEKLMGHAENYYKPSLDYLLAEYIKAIPYLTISETVELKDKIKQQMVISDKKVGEIERDNVSLQDRLNKLESSYGSLKEILEDVLLARTKSK